VNDPIALVAVALVTGVTYYTLPKLIEMIFNRRMAASNAESVQEQIETSRWLKTQKYIQELEAEITRLRKILIRHRIDPNDTIEFSLPDERELNK
jgi:hypothetical protein